MAKDFKASQVRTTQIIASGSTANKPSLLIASASSPGVNFDGGGIGNATLLAGVGRDVFLFVSGAKSSKGTTTAGVSLFGGDLVVSGNLSSSLLNASDLYVENLFVSGNTRLGNASGDSLQVTANSWFDNGLNVSGSVTIAQNLTVNGTTTTINTTNLVVKDPLVYFGSGTTSSNQNGGIALASGSSIANQALVWGRVANDTWGAGRLDVTAGTTTDLTGMSLVPVRTSKLELGGTSAFLSSSSGSDLKISAASSVQVTGSVIIASPGNLIGGGGTATSNSVSFGGGSAAYDSCFVFGNGTSSDIFAFSQGQDTVAKGYGSHAEGLETSAIGFFSHADGWGTIASGTNQTVVGQYNKRNNATSLFVVGNGTGDSNTNRSDIFLIDTNTIRIGSGSSLGTDAFLFVSGATSSRGTSTRGTSVFGGDLVTSGNLLSLSGISGSLTKLTDGTSYLIAGSNVTIVTGTNGAVTISSTGGSGGDSFFTSPQAGFVTTTGSLVILGNETFPPAGTGLGTPTFYVSGTTFLVPDDPVDGPNASYALFGGDSVHSGSLRGALSWQPGVDEVLNISSRHFIYSFGPAPFIGTDTSVFLSGVIGGKDGADRGTTVIGGDAVISGTLYDANGNAYSTGGGGGGDSFFSSTVAGSIFTTGSAAFIGGSTGITSPSDVGSDVFFFVSGNNALIGNDPSLTSNIALFSGDLAVSGVLRGKTDVGGLTGLVQSSEVILFSNSTFNNNSFTDQTDVFLGFGGTSGSKDGATRGVAVFDGDVVVSGTLYDGSGTPYASSDERFKTSITPLSGTIGDIKALTPINYYHKTNLAQRKVGITAQNLQLLCPEAVSINGQNLSIDPVAFSTVLLTHLQSQQSRIEELERKILELESKLP